MFSQPILALALAAFALAYNITSPGDSQNWTTVGPQSATWKRESTDPLKFTAVLTNENRSVMPENNQVLARSVDGTTGHAQFAAPSGGWRQGEGFRLNFCHDEHISDGILAQSNEFAIIDGVGSEGIVPSPGGAPEAQDLDVHTTEKSNGAMARGAFEAAKDGLMGLMGLMGFLALMSV
ncbi:hypothetical protein BDN71DRAFT_1502474 [Pleurotus eryngii]|uniref:Yeast cell wall synthesis Kre9/Knh1-like N-terminal domain-containing protein n=1 Tax=Pleurotus eryngii TaxID=5323 RepID=A0A9P6DB30_PLEER|nr:hypothetical protein BDN71DRAFT_1502474 [Pleurotus eryngii]